MSKLAQSFVYGTSNAMTHGYWGTLRFVSKAQSETHEDFLDRYKPSLMNADIGDGLVVHGGAGEWEQPAMPNHLHYTLGTVMSRRQLSCTGRISSSNHDYKGRGFSDEFAGQKMYDAHMNEAAAKAGLTHGLIRWSCPAPRSTEEESMVDTDWMKLAEGFLGQDIGPKVHAVIIRGPFPAAYLKPQMHTPIRSGREEYKFYVVTDDFRDQDAVSEVNFRLRTLDPASLRGRWAVMNPLWHNYCQWKLKPLYHLPPTGGDVLTRSSLRYHTIGTDFAGKKRDPRPSSIGAYGHSRSYLKPMP